MNRLTALLTTTTAKDMLGMPASTLGWWIKQRVIVPVMPAAGTGTSTILTAQQVWAIGIAKSLRASGVPMEACRSVATFLESRTAAQLKKAFGEGRTCLLIIRVDDGADFFPKLFSPDAITDNPQLQEARRDAEAHGMTMQWTGIDVRPMLNQILGRVAEEEKRTAERVQSARRS